MSWIALVLAGLLEIVWAVALKGGGLTRWSTALPTVATMAASMILLAYALRHLPIGTAYAVWTGIGTVGTAAFGILVLGEAASPSRLVCLALIMVGIAGLKLGHG